MGNKMSALLHGYSALIEKPDTQNAVSLNAIINRGIPHIGELIFKSIDTRELLSCMEVSETWKELAENVLIKRWNEKSDKNAFKDISKNNFKFFDFFT